MNDQLDNIFKHADNIVTRKVMDETLLVPISGDLANMENLYSLNETSAYIWEVLDGNRSLAEISILLEQRYDAQKTVLEKDLIKTINSLVEAGLLEDKSTNE